MKRWIWTLVAAVGLQTTATASTPHTTLVCRMDDPFLFCSKGCDSSDYNWKPVDPISGTWEAVSPYCPFPTPTSTNYCVGWTMKAITALSQYETICPGAVKEGKWEGPRQPELVPFKH
ncbi:hypothetical protein [Xanthomonas fragariae]|uniref:hypothetical protein n=1 Tax=Xanthomonas fragariae TaxID=48664 RepID=UPI001ABE0415|nr:hypothetical protein [Xanthomonas fragariae]UKR52408.1 hypothetical protein K4A87_17910 [Xanthomonas fragariae]WAT15284.1 hypothetical protein OZ429_01810 [Xanthomonas fragariae]